MRPVDYHQFHIPSVLDGQKNYFKARSEESGGKDKSMCTYEKIEYFKKELGKKGYVTEDTVTVKNGIECFGLQIILKNEFISPVVYIDDNEKFEDYFEKVKMATSCLPKVKVEEFINREFFRKNLFLSIERNLGYDQMIIDKKYITENILNIRVFMRINIELDNQKEMDASGSIKISESLLRRADVDIDEAWYWARKNTRSVFEVQSINDVLGIPADMGSAPLYVVTGKKGIRGSAALLFPDVFKDFCIKKGVKACAILPSSLEEVLVLPEEDGIDYDFLAKMVNDVNMDQVDELIQLNPVVYRFDVESEEISIVARYNEDM